jgi:hypothetical protein
MIRFEYKSKFSAAERGVCRLSYTSGLMLKIPNSQAKVNSSELCELIIAAKLEKNRLEKP